MPPSGRKWCDILNRESSWEVAKSLPPGNFYHNGMAENEDIRGKRGSRKDGSFYTTVASHHKILVEERNKTKVWKPTGIELKCKFLSTSTAQEKLPLEENGCIYSSLWKLNKHGCDFFFFALKCYLQNVCILL